MFPSLVQRAVSVLSAATIALFALSGAAFAQSTTTTTATTTSAAAPATARVCDWGKRVWREPQSFHAGAADGYYFWCGPSDDNGSDREFHLRTTDSKGVFLYSGVLRSDGVFTDVEKVRDEPDDHVDVGDNGHTLTYSFVTYQGIDGLNFNVQGGSTVSLKLLQSGSLINVSSIYLGQDGVHPEHDPMAIHRLGERGHIGKPAQPGTTTTATSSATTSGTPAS